MQKTPNHHIHRNCVLRAGDLIVTLFQPVILKFQGDKKLYTLGSDKTKQHVNFAINYY